MRNNRLIYAAAGGIAVAAVAVFFLLAGGFGGGGNSPASGPSGDNGGQQQQQQGQPQVLPPALALKEVKVTPAEEGDEDGDPSMLVTFTVGNPNSATLVLESIHYDVFVDNERVAVGDWGGTGEGFVAGSDRLTVIVAGTTVTIRDADPTIIKKSSNSSSGNAGVFDRLLAEDAQFTVSGTYAYRLTAALNTIAEEKEFSLAYP